MFMLNKFSSSDQLFVETMPWKKKVNGGVPDGKVSAYEHCHNKIFQDIPT
jgi:hypothetical protein